MLVNIAPLKPHLSFNHLLIPELLNIKNCTWEEADIHILIFKCSKHETSCVSETLNALYAILKDSKYKVYFDFCFILNAQDYDVITDNTKYFGFCSKRTPDEFDIIMPSFSYLGDVPSYINFAFHNGISPYHIDRKENTNTPLIIAGGCILSACDFVFPYIDCVSFGEGEGSLNKLVDFYIENNLKTKKIIDRIKILSSEFENITYPLGYDVSFSGIKKVEEWVHPAKFYRCFDNEQTLYTYKLLLDCDKTVSRTNILIAKGCVGKACAMCHEASESQTYREFSIEHIKKGLLEIKRTKPVDTIIPYAFNTNSHSNYPKVFKMCAELFDSCILTGFRADNASEDNNLIEFLVRTKNNRVGIGVEGISDRIRNDILGKNVYNTQILKVAKDCIDTGVLHLKFNMIYTGEENEADWKSFEALLRSIDTYRKIKARENFRVTCSFTSLVYYHTTPIGMKERKSLNSELRRETPIKDFADSIKDLSKIHFKYNTGAENIFLQLLVDYGRNISYLLENFFKDSVQTLTRKRFGEIVEYLLERIPDDRTS